jgi:ankyrin repeat protein
LDFYVTDHKLDLNAKNSKGMSLIMTAVKFGSPNVIDYLLKNKVDLSPNSQGISVLALAAHIGNPETLQKLVEHLKNNVDGKTYKAALEDAITVAKDNKKTKALSYLKKSLAEYAIAK